MRRTFACLLAATALVGCSPSPAPAPSPSTSPSATPSTTPVTHDSALPIDALPEPPAGRSDLVPCPYLDSAWVAETNGQRVLASGVDARFETPACVFWSYAQEPQLTVIVRTTGSESESDQVVNWAAPVNATEPANEPEGWMGGRLGEPGRALYAVSKGNHAVVVFSNQDQSFKAELVAKEVIKNLGL